MAETLIDTNQKKWAQVCIFMLVVCRDGITQDKTDLETRYLEELSCVRAELCEERAAQCGEASQHESLIGGAQVGCVSFI